MQITLTKGIYPDFVGKRSLFVGSGVGPAAYNSATGDPVTVNVSPFYIDMLFGGVLDTTGTYVALVYSAGTGERQTWTVFYTVRSTGAPVANATNLSAYTFNLGGIGGQF